jgi:cell division GTPase FtsZ
MANENTLNRVVVIDGDGNVTKVKSDAEIVKDNEEFEKSLQGSKKPEIKLDENILQKLKEKQKTKEESAMKVVAARDRSIQFGIIGLGHAGSKICQTFHELGYTGVCFNTASQDLEYLSLPNNKKILLNFSDIGGAGKELENGRLAIEQNRDLILSKLKETFSNNQEALLLVISGSGGTGSGGAEEMANLLLSLGKPVGILFVLPMEADALSKHNTVVTLSKLSKLASPPNGKITPLIIVDNAKIELLYPGISKASFWEVANSAIVTPLHLFNKLSANGSRFEALDGMDFSHMFFQDSCLIYGTVEVEDYSDVSSLAEAMVENVENGLLASDFNLNECRYAGFIITGNSNALNKLQAVSVNYCEHIINELCHNPQIFKGVYEIEDSSDSIKVYYMFSGLGLPSARIKNLQTQATEQMLAMKEKEKACVDKMIVEYGSSGDTDNKAKEINRIIQQKKTGFGKLTANVNKKVTDYRKR